MTYINTGDMFDQCGNGAGVQVEVVAGGGVGLDVMNDVVVGGSGGLEMDGGGLQTEVVADAVVVGAVEEIVKQS